jgi:predicted phosphodiesterase
MSVAKLKFYNCFIKRLKLLFHIPRIPEELINRGEPILLHISDIPAETFRYVYRIISAVRPEYLVHTGDFVDNIKHTNNRKAFHEHKVKLKGFLTFVESCSIKKIYFVPGNHDDIQMLESMIGRTEIVEEGTLIRVKEVVFAVAHEAENLKGDADFYLFGHSFYERRGERHTNYLNGIDSVNIVFLDSKKVFTIPYPYGTNDLRRMYQFRRTGL